MQVSRKKQREERRRKGVPGIRGRINPAIPIVMLRVPRVLSRYFPVSVIRANHASIEGLSALWAGKMGRMARESARSIVIKR
jgi:hypothetical protein